MASNLNSNHLFRVTITEEPINQMDAESRLIWNYYDRNVQDQTLFDKKLQIKAELSDIFAPFTRPLKGREFVGLFITGSTINGFADKGSDLDMCFALEDFYGYDFERKKKFIVLKKIQSILRFRPYQMTGENLIPTARVPIFKFKHFVPTEGQNVANTQQIPEIEVDISINAIDGVRNTRLLYCYSNLDWRVAPIVLAAKRWAKEYKVLDPVKGKLNSYGLEIMVIFFMQICKPQILPCLQVTDPDMFDIDADITALTELPNLDELIQKHKTSVSANDWSLSETFLEFFKYYNGFAYERDVISIRLGRLVSIAECLTPYRNPKPFTQGTRCPSMVHIEEPFRRQNVSINISEHIGIIRNSFDVMVKNYTQQTLEKLFA